MGSWGVLGGKTVRKPKMYLEVCVRAQTLKWWGYVDEKVALKRGHEMFVPRRVPSFHSSLSSGAVEIQGLGA